MVVDVDAVTPVESGPSGFASPLCREGWPFLSSPGPRSGPSLIPGLPRAGFPAPGPLGASHPAWRGCECAGRYRRNQGAAGETNRKPGFTAAPDSGPVAPEPCITRACRGLRLAKEPREWARGLETPQQKTGARSDGAGIGFLLISPTSPQPPS